MSIDSWFIERLTSYGAASPAIEVVPIDILRMNLRYRLRVTKSMDPLRHLALQTIADLGGGMKLPLAELANITGLPHPVVGRLANDLVEYGLAVVDEATIVLDASVNVTADSISREEERQICCFALSIAGSEAQALPLRSIKPKQLHDIPVEPSPSTPPPQPPTAMALAAIIAPAALSPEIDEIKSRRYLARITPQSKDGDILVELIDPSTECPRFQFDLSKDHPAIRPAVDLIATAIERLPNLFAGFGQWRDDALVLSQEGWRSWKRSGGRLKSWAALSDGSFVLSVPVKVRPSTSTVAEAMFEDCLIDILDRTPCQVNSGVLHRAATEASKELDCEQMQPRSCRELADVAWEDGRWALAYRLQAEDDCL